MLNDFVDLETEHFVFSDFISVFCCSGFFSLLQSIHSAQLCSLLELRGQLCAVFEYAFAVNAKYHLHKEQTQNANTFI